MRASCFLLTIAEEDAAAGHVFEKSPAGGYPSDTAANMESNFREDEAEDCYSLPLPGLHEHFGQALSYEKMTAGTAALEQECAMDPAMAELRQHLIRHRISFCVFDSKCSS